MRNITRVLVAALLTIGASVQAHAQTVFPNFAGTWEMNAAKSNYGQFPLPSKNVMVVTQNEKEIKVAQTIAGPQGDVVLNQNFSLDGQPTTAPTFNNSVAIITAKLDANGLATVTKVTTPQGELTQNSTWTLSPDGKVLTLEQAMKTQMGDLAFHVVFDKKQ